MREETITFQKYSLDKTPNDVLEYGAKLNGICGEASIAALLECNLKRVFEVWEIGEDNFNGFTIQKDMRIILEKFGYKSIQKRIGDKFKLPDCNLAIIRVSFGDPKQHWMLTAKNSHYITIKRFAQGRYIYDNAIDNFDGKPVNGVWIEESEYYKVMADQKTFITSYLEVIPNVCGNCGLRHLENTKCSVQPESGEWFFKEFSSLSSPSLSQSQSRGKTE